MRGAGDRTLRKPIFKQNVEDEAPTKEQEGWPEKLGANKEGMLLLETETEWPDATKLRRGPESASGLNSKEAGLNLVK